MPQPPAIAVPAAPEDNPVAAAPPARPLLPEGTPLPAWAQRVVYEDEHVVMEWTVRTPATDALAVTFDPILVEPSQPAYAATFLQRAGIDTLCVRKKREHFYQPLSRAAFEAAAAPVFAHYRRRLAYGSSLGAYAVLYFCAHGFETVISSSPRVSAHPRFGRPYWQERAPFQHERFSAAQPASSGAVVFYDPHDALDRRLVDEELRPAWPQARFVAVPYAGHPANEFLSEIGYIGPFVQAVVRGLPEPALDRRGRKSRSFSYRHVLAMACLRHGKPRWAERLCRAALAMKPDLVAVKLTLGQALLALGQLDDAEQALREFQHKYPDDGDAAQALRTIAQQRLRDARRHDLPALAARLRQRWARLRADRRDRRARARLEQPWWAGRLRLAVSREEVDWCYRLLLGRPPESEEALQSHRGCRRFEQLARAFIGSSEYQSRLRGRPAQPPLELRVRFACLVRRLLPLGGQMADIGAAGIFGAAACEPLDGTARPEGAAPGAVRTGLELALWADPLRAHDGATLLALRTLARAVRPGGHALVAVRGEVDTAWNDLFSATSFERLLVDRSPAVGGVSIVWVRRRTPGAIRR
jgi:hypothetical protein